MAGFIFGAPGLPKTQQELENLRKIAQAMALHQQAAPKNIGEGLTAIGNALAYRSMVDDLNAGAADIAKRQGSVWSDIGSLFGGGAAATPTPTLTPAAATPAPVTDTAKVALSGSPMADTPAPLSGGAVAPSPAPVAANTPPASGPQTAQLPDGSTIPLPRPFPIADNTAQMGVGYAWGRQPSVNGLIIHHTGGGGDVNGVIDTLHQRDLGAQYVVDQNGGIHQLMPDYARGRQILPGTGAGAGLNNNNTVGVEVIANNDKAVNPAQVSATEALASRLGLKYGFDPATATFGHGQVNPGHKEADEGATITAAIRGMPTAMASAAGPQASPNAPAAPNALVRAGDALAGFLGPSSAFADTAVPSANPLASIPPRQQVVQALTGGFTPGALPNVTNVPTRPVDLPPEMGAREAVTRALLGQNGAPAPTAPVAPATPPAAPQAVDPRRQQAMRAIQILQQHPEISDEQRAILGKVIQEGLAVDKKTNDIINFEYSQGHPGFSDFKHKTEGKFGLNPVYGTGPDGKPVVIQLGSDGKPNVVSLPNGVTVSTGIEKVDLGTQWGMLDKRSGQIVGYMPKDIKGKAEQEAEGKGNGAAVVAYKSMASKMPGLEKVVSELDDLSEKATYTSTGQIIDWTRRELGMQPRDAAVARATYTAKVDNQILPLLRDTFGAQFTEREGASLRATMGDPNKTPAEKQAVLKAFIEQKRRDMEALANQAGISPAPQVAPAAAAPAPALPQGWSVKVH